MVVQIDLLLSNAPLTGGTNELPSLPLETVPIIS